MTPVLWVLNDVLESNLVGVRHIHFNDHELPQFLLPIPYHSKILLYPNISGNDTERILIGDPIMSG